MSGVGDIASTEPLDELGVAKAMVADTLPSPQRYGNLTLFLMRVTGTGIAYRRGIDEFVFRDPAVFLSPALLERFNGLPILLEHPSGGIIDSDEYASRNIGTMILPHVRGEEAWAIGKVYDAAAAQMMTEQQLSTSPSVVFTPASGSEVVELNNGRHLLIEGVPACVDHCAVCILGTWDRDGQPRGISTQGIAPMANDDKKPEDTDDNVRKDAESLASPKDGETLDKVLAALDGLHKRLDAMEAGAKQDGAVAPPDPMDNEMASDAYKRRAADAAEQRRADAALAHMQAKADAVWQSWGKSAPPPLAGELLTVYRVRLANHMKIYSKAFAGVDLGAIAAADSAALDSIETQIYADAVEASQSPGGLPGGQFRAVKRVDPASGVHTTRFYGDGTFIGRIKPDSMRVVKFHTSPGNHERA